MDPSLLIKAAEASPAIALSAFSVWVIYKVSMRALDALQENTKALTSLQELLKEDRRAP